VEITALVEQAAFFAAQSFELVAGERRSDVRRGGAGDAEQYYAGGADDGPACAASLRIGLAHEARVIDLFAEQQNVFVRQGAQGEGVALGARRRGAARG